MRLAAASERDLEQDEISAGETSLAFIWCETARQLAEASIFTL
jgi:hypothetical protein